MMRTAQRYGLVFCAVLAIAVPAGAEPALSTSGRAGRRLSIITPAATTRAAPRARVSSTIYLERCAGGCTLHMGDNDARASSSKLLLVGSATVSEFATRDGRVGAAADAEWGLIVQCMKEVYSPYDVVVTDVKPGAGASYHEAIIAGHPEEIGRTSDILGVAPLAKDCSAIDNVISMTFANAHASQSVAGRVLNICWTAAQESAHAFGLDHEYAFLVGNRSTCSDPMTYRSDCGGQKFFRDEPAACGENTMRACQCSPSQNSHEKLLAVFGPGTPTTRPPTITMLLPNSDSTSLDSDVLAKAGAQRGVARVELHVNGNKWAEASGAAFQLGGQPDPSSYSIAVPAGVPDGILDVQVVAFDDLGVSTASDVVTLTKGAPCTSAASCAGGQTCEAGKCLWGPPSGELGASCTYPQFCKAGLCEGAADEQICTQGCVPGVAESCPDDFECVQTTPETGVCAVAATTAGCCRVDRGDPGWAQLGIGALVLAFAIRKRRR
jgi:MYXO-CTERM domain-containing protein